MAFYDHLTFRTSRASNSLRAVRAAPRLGQRVSEDEPRQITCVVGDDHETLRRGLVALIDAEDDLTVIGQAGDGGEALALTRRRRPDVTVVDVRMPVMDGIALCREITAEELPTRVVLYTAFDDLAALEQALEAGAAGYVLKSGPPQELLRAVRVVNGGRPYVDATLAPDLLERKATAARSLLTPREIEVLQHLADGLTNEATAAALFLSPTTVRSYAENAMAKLEANNRLHAVVKALRLGLID